MSRSGDTFINVRMEEEYYASLPPSVRDNMEVRYVNVDGIDYESDEQWCMLKKESDKSFAKLKDREYDLRHNNKQNG